MSAFREALRDMLERDLVCPKCGETNSRSHRQIEVDTITSRAYCNQCSCEGPIDRFQPRVKTADSTEA